MQALLTLNSCPMFTYNGRDAHRNLPASRIHLPPKGAIVEILPDRTKTEEDEADPALLRLPAPGLRGTWARAYALLTRLVSKIGWDELLKTRSAVFVMEEEYRMQKQHSELHTTQSPSADDNDTVIHEDGSVTKRSSTLGEGSTLADDNASTKGVRSTTPAHSTKTSEVDGITNGIPIIRISTESNRERLKQEQEAEPKVNGKDANAAEEAGNSLEKPVSAGGQDAEASSGPGQEAFSFSNKRLCERWLDNLFMVLYEVFHLSCPSYLYAQVLFRIFECGQSSGLKLLISRHSTSPTEKLAWSGRSWATSVFACITKKKRRRRTNDAWTPTDTR